MRTNRRAGLPFLLAFAIAAHGCSATISRATETAENGDTASRSGQLWRVGPSRSLEAPSAAARVARDGDVVEIDAATYAGDAAVWRQNRLTIRGVGGRPHLRADGAQVEGKAIWVIKGTDTVLENIEFSGARVADGNGAAIRPEGAGLTLRDCSFHDNENGVMGGANPASEIRIERCEFAHNGRGDGQTHNLYIGAVKLLQVDHSHSHHAVIGHNLKSRARETIVTFSRFGDGESGRSSYALDLPNGGKVSLVGNVIEHGPQAENSTLVSYGAEGLQDSANELRVRNNTFVNDRAAGGVFIFISPSTPSALVEANLFAGPGTVVQGPASVRDNRVVPTTPGVDRTRAPDGVSVGPGGE